MAILTAFPKIIISVFKGSTIERQLKVLEEYKMDVEVCYPTYRRLRSSWDNKVTIEGTLTPSRF